MEQDPNEIDLDADISEQSKQMDVDQNTTQRVESKEKGKGEKSKSKKKKPKIRFRNYIPKDAKLKKKYCVAPAAFIEIKDEFTELIEKAKVLNHDIHDITPKKANWDLKRDCQPQLDQLKYLTQLAIRQIVGMILSSFWILLRKILAPLHLFIAFRCSLFVIYTEERQANMSEDDSDDDSDDEDESESDDTDDTNDD